MIKTQRAYRHTQKTVAGLEAALHDYQQRGGRDLSPRLRQATLDAMQSVIDEWRGEISEYEALRAGRTSIVLRSLDELPLALIKARIAAGLTQQQLAQRLGLKAQQIQRYEASDYRTVPFGRARDIAEALGVSLEAHIEVGQ